MSALLLISTADTDLLALRRASAEVPDGFGGIEAFNPVRLDVAEIERIVALAESGAYWAVCLRLLGGRKAMPDGFDKLRRAAAVSNTAFLAWPGERGKDFELESATTCDPALLEHCADKL